MSRNRMILIYIRKLMLSIFLLWLLTSAGFSRKLDAAAPIAQYVQKNHTHFSTPCSKRFILTGGPGTGKTTLINYFHQLGYGIAREAATDLICEELTKQALTPWSARNFNERVALLQEKRQQELLEMEEEVAFFDRSPIDALTYELMYDFEPTEALLRVVQQTLDEHFYHPKVFLIEDLGSCLQTEIRPETLKESQKIETVLEENYRELGFEVVRVPAASVKERAETILKVIRNNIVK